LASISSNFFPTSAISSPVLILFSRADKRPVSFTAKGTISARSGAVADGSSLALSGDATISSSVVTISNDAIDYEKIDPEFSTASTLTPGATVDIDFDLAQVFNLTLDQTTVLNITNPKIGMTKCIILTGTGNSYTISLPECLWPATGNIRS